MSALTRPLSWYMPVDRLRQWFLDRVRRRRGAVALPFEFEYRHVYVLPTVFGSAFAIMLVLTALGGLNFNNNMALLLVFVLAVIAQMTTVLAYRNMAGLRIETITAEPVFCGECARFRVFLGNPDDRSRLAIGAGYGGLLDCVDIAGRSSFPVVLEQPTHERGWLRMEPFHLENRYPLGMFRAWSWFFPDARCLVYPAPARQPPPLPATGTGYVGEAVKGEGEQVHGLREYRPGDSPRRIAWRTSARHGDLYTREMERPREQACEIDWDLLPGVDTETRLRILTSWILLAERHQLDYGLLLPGSRIPPSQGPEHRAHCLKKLALFGT